MISRSTPILSVLLLADDLQLWDEKMFVFTPACVSVFFDSSSYCVFVRLTIRAYFLVAAIGHSFEFFNFL